MVLLSAGSLSAQTSSIWSDPAIGGEGKADPRQEFVSYVTRETAVKGDPNEAPHYLPLDGKWRVLLSTTDEGGEPGFYRPGFTSSAWQEVTVPNLEPDRGSDPFLDLMPPQLPPENPLVQYRAVIDVPYLWLDRDMFVHIEGVGGAYTLYVNDRRIGP